MTKIPLNSRTDLGRPKLHWTTEIGARHHVVRAHLAPKICSSRRYVECVMKINIFPSNCCCCL
ncbi:hypothetical protein RHMOL_Rhmol12G0119800 [Rhododendron molle]|uniref:Uncharacterized protein n=1 Tax=Rhododendron molle TaxID=49168 RepID=A0ACC0LID6_RHOML|nr:hypothetical protein RHMOL_Rhmol12G0119800 [Rhododendron molle]